MNRTRTFTYTLLLIITLLLTQVATATAQSGPRFALSAGTVSSGGGIQSGGTYQLVATVGQLSGTVNGGRYAIDLGFMSVVGPLPQTKIYLPIVNR